MPDKQLIPLFLLGTLVIMGFVITIVFSLVIQKQRQVKATLARQQLEFDHKQLLLTSRYEVQNTTLNMVAQELHDNIVQSLTGCYMQVGSLSRHLAVLRDSDPVAEAKATLQQIIGDVRLLSHSLAAGLNEKRELHEAIQAELSRLERFAGLRYQLQSDTIYELAPEQRLIAFRIVQELLQNVVKHARASTVWVHIDSTNTQYLIRVKDNGQGFDTAAGPGTNSLGLVSMHERIALLRGELRIRSIAGEGTEVDIHIPIDRHD
jgi:hypothetical protein